MKELKNAYISEVGNLLIVDRELKNGDIYGNEISRGGDEEVQWKVGEEKNRIGQAIPVYGVVGKDNQVLTEQLPFYFQEDYAKSAAKQMNDSVTEKKKPYKVKKAYLIYPIPHTLKSNK
jgi:hypothetical protein